MNISFSRSGNPVRVMSASSLTHEVERQTRENLARKFQKKKHPMSFLLPIEVVSTLNCEHLKSFRLILSLLDHVTDRYAVTRPNFDRIRNEWIRIWCSFNFRFTLMNINHNSFFLLICILFAGTMQTLWIWIIGSLNMEFNGFVTDQCDDVSQNIVFDPSSNISPAEYRW